MSIAYIGLGSNAGNKAENISRAITLLSQIDDVKVLSVSPLYETEPVGYEDQDWFINAVTKIETTISPYELFKSLKRIEKIMGRKESIVWGPREIDLDLLLYDQLCLESAELIIPHPRMHQRAFVLIPLAEIAENVSHPKLHKTVKALLNELRSPKIVRRFDI